MKMGSRKDMLFFKLQDHINDGSVHITDSERAAWNVLLTTVPQLHTELVALRNTYSTLGTKIEETEDRLNTQITDAIDVYNLKIEKTFKTKLDVDTFNEFNNTLRSQLQQFVTMQLLQQFGFLTKHQSIKKISDGTNTYSLVGEGTITINAGSGIINEITQATDTTLGGFKLGYRANGRNYPVQLADGKAFVNVPWESGNNSGINNDVQAALDETTRKIDNINKDINKLADTLNKTAKDQLANQVKEAEAALNDAKKKIDDAKAKLDTFMASSGAQYIVEKTGQIKAFAEWYDKEKNTIAQLTTTLNAQLAQIQTLGTKVDTMNNTVTEYGKTIDLTKKEINEKFKTVDTINNKLSEVSTKISVIEPKVETTVSKVFPNGIAQASQIEINSQGITSLTAKQTATDTFISGMKTKVGDDGSKLETFVQKTAKDGIKGAYIVQEINNSGSSVTISADKINLDGEAIARKISTYGLKVLDNNDKAVAGLNGEKTDKSTVRFWAGEPETPDDYTTSKFNVTGEGKLKAIDAEIQGNINATTGRIGGFKITDGALSNQYTNTDAGIYIKNDNLFAGIGNVIPPSSGMKIAAMMYNANENQFGINTALGVYATGGMYNYAIDMPHGCIRGFRMDAKTTNTDYTLSKSDNALLVNGAATITIPSGCDNGHVYQIYPGGYSITVKTSAANEEIIWYHGGLHKGTEFSLSEANNRPYKLIFFKYYSGGGYWVSDIYW